jgi:cation diffusion facilitator CzcD-associated flavoprotein CzcO
MRSCTVEARPLQAEPAQNVNAFAFTPKHGSWRQAANHYHCPVDVAIIGAGVSGIAAARALRAVGLQVVLYEASDDIGGVWSTDRRYPGISLQSDKQTYSFSNAPMPPHYPKYPTGAQVRRYLADYARDEGLVPSIRTSTRVREAEIDDDGLWHLVLDTPAGPETARADWLVVANGLSSSPQVPAMPGLDEFKASGGVVLTPSQVGDGEVLAGRRVVVLGYGKSAADLAVAASGIARSTDLVVRSIAWKLPKRIGPLRYQHLLVTRGGEFLLWAPYRTTAGRLVRIATAVPRGLVRRMLERSVRRSQHLDRRRLRPHVPLTTLSHLVTDGFFEAIDERLITVSAETVITGLGASEQGPVVRLGDGTTITSDVLIAATGYDQDLQFFGPRAKEALIGDAAELVLQRHTLPMHLERIAFVGWAESFRSPLGAEIQSLWVAAHIRGLTSPVRRRQPLERRYRLTHEGAHRRGVRLTSSGSGFLDLDEWIEEAGLTVPMRLRFKEIFRPIDPSDYEHLLGALVRRSRDAGAAGPGTATRTLRTTLHGRGSAAPRPHVVQAGSSSD